MRFADLTPPAFCSVPSLFHCAHRSTHCNWPFSLASLQRRWVLCSHHSISQSRGNGWGGPKQQHRHAASSSADLHAGRISCGVCLPVLFSSSMDDNFDDRLFFLIQCVALLSWCAGALTAFPPPTCAIYLLTKCCFTFGRYVFEMAVSTLLLCYCEVLNALRANS